jgi:hypothetical protein
VRILIALFTVIGAGAATGDVAQSIAPMLPGIVVSGRKSESEAAPRGRIVCDLREILPSEAPVAVTTPTRPNRPLRSPPESAVWMMFGGLSSRQERLFVARMTEDFLFDSDTPEFRAAFPSGMTREDERAFASHLLHGGKQGPDGRPLPIAVGVDTLVRPMASVSIDSTGTKALVVLDRLHVRFRMIDGTVFELSDTRNEFELVSDEYGWKVRRWREVSSPPRADEPTDPRADADRDSTSAVRDSLRAALPTRLALTAYASRGRNALVFDLALPRAGGVLELFDVMGRRVTQRSLSDLPAGRHTLTLEGARYPSGVYWARLRQTNATATSKLVWAR